MAKCPAGQIQFVEPGNSIGEQFAAFQAAQFTRWGNMVKSLDIRVE